MLTHKPKILLTGSIDARGVEFADASLSLSGRYSEAVWMAGGFPWPVPILNDPGFVSEAVAEVDGVLLTGGGDVACDLYCEDLEPRLRSTLASVHPARDLFELLVIQEVFSQQKPIFAICRGHQVLNVALGGTLYADIRTQVPTALDHARSDLKDEVVQDVQIVPDSIAARVLGTREIRVNSAHHQAVDKIAKPLRATGRTSDGIVEILELASDSRFLLPYLLSVQFHPERLVAKSTGHLGLLQSFTSACCHLRQEPL